MKIIFLFLPAIFSILFVNAQQALLATGNTNITVEKNANVYVDGGILLENNSTLHKMVTSYLQKTITQKPILLIIL
jgi:uncharacterized protein YpmS